ncbi:9103_t:CDS:2, partial [Funneliformis geosporum]
AAHNLVEDCERLAEFFTGIREFRNARKELLAFNNQQEFDNNKQSLLTKITEAVNGLQMKTSNNSSIGGVCIIWNDFADSLNSEIENFRKDLELLKTGIERVPYNEMKELQKLLSDERKLQKEIEENERKARNEPDDNKKKQFIFLAAVENKLSGRNRPPRTTRTNPNPQGTGFGNGGGGSSTTTDPSTSYSNYSPNSNNNQDQKPFTEKYLKEILLGVI